MTRRTARRSRAPPPRRAPIRTRSTSWRRRGSSGSRACASRCAIPSCAPRSTARPRSGARRRAHLALAQVLDGERRTWHRAAAADGPDPVLAADLEAFAADARHRSAYAAAAAALERAALLTTEPSQRAHRLAAAAECNWDAGRVERVEPLLDQALPLLGPEQRASLGLLRGDLALERGRPAEAFELFVDAAGGLGRRDPTFALEMLARAAEATWWLGETGHGGRAAPRRREGRADRRRRRDAAAAPAARRRARARARLRRRCRGPARGAARGGRGRLPARDRGGLRRGARRAARRGSRVVRARRHAAADGGQAARAAVRAQPAGHDGAVAGERAARRPRSWRRRRGLALDDRSGAQRQARIRDAGDGRGGPRPRGRGARRRGGRGRGTDRGRGAAGVARGVGARAPRARARAPGRGARAPAGRAARREGRVAPARAR